MRILHLFSNAKWTGPAEPALNLCVALRRLGIDVDFACTPKAKAPVHKIIETARERGIEPILRFRLPKHAHPVLNFLDARALTAFLKQSPYDLIHCHLDNDHRIASGPATKLGIPLVRTSYHGTGFPVTARHRRLLARTDWLIEPGRLAQKHDVNTFGFPEGRTRVVANAVDTERFDPAREAPDGRARLGIAPDAFVVGIVARLQTHRRFEDFWQALRRLVDAHSNTQVIVVGRGTKQERVALEPVRKMGLDDRVHFSGYVDGEDYVGMLKAFDAKVYLVPGSDGTCRAVREALAMAKPVVVADRGMLREIVDDGKTGFVCDGSPDALFQHLERLAKDAELRQAMGAAARKTALERYALETQARGVAAAYQEALRTS